MYILIILIVANYLNFYPNSASSITYIPNLTKEVCETMAKDFKQKNEGLRYDIHTNCYKSN